MKINFLLILGVAVIFSCKPNSKPQAEDNIIMPSQATIAFGSCAHSYDSMPIFNAIVSHKPAVWVWLGDIMYGDTHDMTLLKSKYDAQKEKQEYQNLLLNSKVIGVWDDHDYGINDGGKYYAKKDESKALLLDFLEVADDDPVRSHNGVYAEYDFEMTDKLVKIILLDTRYFRDTLDPDLGSTARYLPNLTGDILGEGQWQWLENTLRNSKADFHILGSSIQLIADEQGYEKWANFPTARARIFKLLAEINPKPLIIISGDRHIAELSKIELPGLSYPLYDFTSSGLTHTWGMYRPEPNQYRVDSLIVAKNFGLIRLDWQQENLMVTLEVRGEYDELIQEVLIEY